MAGTVGVAGTNRAFVPTTQYATTNLAGWVVRVNRELLTTHSSIRMACEHAVAKGGYGAAARGRRAARHGPTP